MRTITNTQRIEARDTADFLRGLALDDEIIESRVYQRWLMIAAEQIERLILTGDIR